MTTEEHLLEEFADGSQLAITRRRALLPVWMKIFIWLFIVAGCICVPLFILGLVGMNFQVALYGLESNDSTSFVGMLVLLLFIFKGLVSFGLWFEAKWAVGLGIIDAGVGLLICFVTTFRPDLFPGNQAARFFRLEIIFLVVYLIKLFRIREKWKLSLGPSSKW